MKNLTLLVFILISCCSNIQSQEINFGVKGGLNLSTVTGDVSDAVNPRLAYHFGGFMNLPISNRISVNPEILYFSIGSTTNISIEELRIFNVEPTPVLNSNLRSVQRANFLVIPLNLRYNFTNRFGLDFGPQIGFLLNTVNKLKESFQADDNLERQSSPGDFRTDYGANLGLTFFVNDQLNFQLRYYQGLKNLNRGRFAAEFQTFNVALQLSAGYVLF
ncbi:porin family protein [Maribacter sp. 2210JD10-5]|uniref:porin family protein n=1 Tax=Maribacter sp. 2210JD10-5 TaxID=3386272 RepID=UPI0039BC4993